MKKIFGLVSIIAILVLCLSSLVFASAGTDQFRSAVKTITDNIRIGATVLIALAATITAIMYMASSVNPKMKDNAKAALFGLIVGIIVLVLANDIARMVAGLTGGTIDTNSGQISSPISNTTP